MQRPLKVYVPKSQNLGFLATGMVTDGAVWKHLACSIIVPQAPTPAAATWKPGLRYVQLLENLFILSRNLRGTSACFVLLHNTFPVLKKTCLGD